MTRPHDLAADLPPPNPDEPATLRQDIVDELADHLACAARQEALRAELDTDGETPDEQTITDRVLARFGDPRRIARRLWFDAMKGRLMMQKLTAAFAAVAAVGAIAGCVLLWTALDATRSTLAEAIAENRKDRQSSEDANRAVLAQLAKLQTDAKKPPRSLEWNPLRVKLVLDDGKRSPAVGYNVYLSGQPYMGGKEEGVSKRSDENGVANFGKVRPGQFRLIVYTPWNTSHFGQLLIQPGDDVEKTIVCPSRKVEETKLRFELDLPADLAKRNLSAAVLISKPYQTCENQWWTHSFGASGYFLLSSESKVQRLETSSLRIAPMNSTSPTTQFLGRVTELDMVRLRRQFSRSRAQPGSWNWYSATYRLEHVVLILPWERPLPPKYGSAADRTFHLAVDAVSYGHQRGTGGLLITDVPTFEPKTGVDNVWKITLPPKMIENARKRLMAWDERQAELQKQTNAQIREYFSVMDANKDGVLQPNEWNASKRIKPAFEKAKVDLTKDMSEQEFVRHYIRIFQPGKQKQPAKQPPKSRRRRRD